MSEFEYGILFVEFLNTSNVVFANYMTLVFAVLTASWFLAKRMTLSVAICFLALFTLAALAIGFGVLFAFSDFFALQLHLYDAHQASDALVWLGPIRADGPPPFRVMQIFVMAVIGFSYVGAVAFFFIVRHTGDAPTAQAGDETS